MDTVLRFLDSGLLDASWWQILIFTLVTTHITIASVTIFLHRAQAHRALWLHPIVSHFFRFWLWIGTGMVTKEWVAIHRKHHAKCETAEDPHSPVIRGIGTVLLEGSELYRAEAKKKETLSEYGHDTPDDWIEHILYSRHTKLGIGLLFAIDVLCFGIIGIAVWAVQMIWIPVMAAGIINGIGHWRGYRNFRISDASTNIVPWGILIGGEELHNNHHTYPTSAKFSVRWWEFDLAWGYIRVLEFLGLAKVKKRAPQIKINRDVCGVPDAVDLEAVIASRHELVARFARILRRHHMDRKLFRTVRHYRQQLEHTWQDAGKKREDLERGLIAWCQQATRSGIPALQRLAWKLSGYRLKG